MARRPSKDHIHCTVRAVAADIGPVKLYRFYPDGHKDNTELSQEQAQRVYPRSQFKWRVVLPQNLPAPRDVIPF